MRLTRRTVLVGAATAALVLGIPATADAEVPVSQVGWWTRSPVPPTVPEGGVAVGAAPDGDLTVSAVLLDTGEGGATGVTLRLVETSGGSPLAAIQVCPTDPGFSPEAGGALADAPKDDCASATVAMQRAEDGTWSADVQPLVDGKTGDVALILKPAADAVAFQVSFAPPAAEGTPSSAAAGEETSSAPEGETSPSFETSPSSEPTFDSGASDSSSFPATSGSDSSFSFSDSGTFSPETPATPEPTQPSFIGGTSPTPAPTPVSDAPEGDQFAGALPPVTSPGSEGGDVGAFTVVLWYVVAAVVGGIAAAIAWANENGRLSPTALLALVRRNAPAA